MKILCSFLVFWGVLTFSFLGFAAEISSISLLQAAINSAIGYDLEVQLTGTGSGVVKSNPPGINCGTDCIEEYNPKTLVTLTATAYVGSYFAGWEDACPNSDQPTCAVSMDQARSVSAIFRLIPVVTEEGRFHGLFNGGRPTFYFSKMMADYPSRFTVTMEGCETAVVTYNNGERFETNLLIIKQSDVAGRGMAVTTTGGVCESSRTCTVRYYDQH